MLKALMAIGLSMAFSTVVASETPPATPPHQDSATTTETRQQQKNWKPINHQRKTNLRPSNHPILRKNRVWPIIVENILAKFEQRNSRNDEN